MPRAGELPTDAGEPKASPWWLSPASLLSGERPMPVTARTPATAKAPLVPVNPDAVSCELSAAELLAPPLVALDAGTRVGEAPLASELPSSELLVAGQPVTLCVY